MQLKTLKMHFFGPVLTIIQDFLFLFYIILNVAGFVVKNTKNQLYNHIKINHQYQIKMDNKISARNYFCFSS